VHLSKQEETTMPMTEIDCEVRDLIDRLGLPGEEIEILEAIQRRMNIRWSYFLSNAISHRLWDSPEGEAIDRKRFGC
jgi:hypothetical protein